MQTITSRTNEKVKLASSLKLSRNRAELGLFLAEGERLVRDALDSGLTLKWLFVKDSVVGKVPHILDRVDTDSVFVITESVSEKLQDTKTSQGIFAVLELPQVDFPLDPQGKYVVLENLQNPSNVGAILRSAEAFGLQGAVLVNCPDPFSPKALRGGMGCVFRLPTAVVSDFELLEQFKDSGISLVASVVRGATKSPEDLKDLGGVALVIGNEGNGVSDELVNIATDSVTITMRGRAESLNAASAAAVMMYELMK